LGLELAAALRICLIRNGEPDELCEELGLCFYRAALLLRVGFGSIE
jgi:hypothetical protein